MKNGIILTFGLYCMLAANSCICLQAAENRTETEAAAVTVIPDNLEDGVYEPDGFSWSGGTGRVEITCDSVEIRDGQTWATLIFDSGSYGYVRVEDAVYEPEHEGDTSVFVIPVHLNQDMEITGMTTKMSQAHEITYKVFISLGADVQNSGGEQAGEAPEIVGLNCIEAVQNEAAEYFRIYRYEQGVELLEISLEGVFGEGSEEESLYGGNVIRYLIVPEEVQVPGGIQKHAVIVQKPAERVYPASETAVQWMDRLELSDRIIGSGAAGETDFKSLVTMQCDLAVLSGDTSFLERDALREELEYYEVLGIPAVVDCSAEEKDEKARDEWVKVYGVLFGCEAEAEQDYGGNHEN